MELEFVPTDDLIEELMKRFDNVVFVGSKDMTDESSSRVMYWSCETLAAGIGLAAVLQHRLIHRMEKRGRDVT